MLWNESSHGVQTATSRLLLIKWQPSAPENDFNWSLSPQSVWSFQFYTAVILLASRTPLRYAPVTVWGKCRFVAWVGVRGGEKTPSQSLREMNWHLFFSFLQRHGSVYLASKEDFPLHVFSQDVVSLSTSPRFHKAVGHLWPHVFAPVGDEIIQRLGDLLTEKHRWRRYSNFLF